MTEDFLTISIRKEYPEFVLDVSFESEKSIIGVFGPTGSGKSTLLDCVSGFTTPNDGSISLNGRYLFRKSGNSHTNVPSEFRRVGYMFQRGFLFPHLTVKENILFGYKLLPPELRRLDVESLIGILDLQSLLSRHPSSLSGGERQKVALARALATAPELLILDEPLANLDLTSRRRILRYLGLIYSEFDIPMLYVSHSFPEISALADRVIVLNDGQIVGDGPPSLMLSQRIIQEVVPGDGLEDFGI